jgi:hypothetical protein
VCFIEALLSSRIVKLFEDEYDFGLSNLKAERQKLSKPFNEERFGFFVGLS